MTSKVLLILVVVYLLAAPTPKKAIGVWRCKINNDSLWKGCAACWPVRATIVIVLAALCAM